MIKKNKMPQTSPYPILKGQGVYNPVSWNEAEPDKTINVKTERSLFKKSGNSDKVKFEYKTGQMPERKEYKISFFGQYGSGKKKLKKKK